MATSSTYSRCRPPSTRMVSPVMKSVWQRSATALAISASPPQWPTGVALATSSISSLAHVGRRDDRTRCDGVDEDVVPCDLEGQRFRERDDTGLGDVVGRKPV